MKKFLVILMVVAMASFLFVGCLPGVTPDVDEDDEDEDVVPTSATPVLTAVETSAAVSIFDVTSTSTLYMNKTEVGTSILVKGTAPSESLVQLYIDDVAILPAVAEASTSGLWTVAVAKSSLGDDGVKVLTAKVTEVGLAESEASNSVTFTYDTDLPGFSIAATAAAAASGAALDSGIMVITSGANPIGLLADIAAIDAVPGDWTIFCTGNSSVATSVANVLVTTPAGVTTSYYVQTPVVPLGFITGFNTTLTDNFKAGDGVTVTVTAAGVVAAVISRATITFDEDVSAAGAAAGTYTTIGDPVTYRTATDTGYWNTITVGAAGATYTLTAYGFYDLAGNVGGTATSLLSASCTVGAASATLLQP